MHLPPPILEPLLAFCLGLGVVFLSIPLILRWCARFPILNRARDLHHSHRQPIPRLGGLALAAAFVAIELCFLLLDPDRRTKTPGRNVVILSSLGMFGLGFWDDLRGLGAKKKLLGQVLLAVIVYCNGVGVQYLSVPFMHHGIAIHWWGLPVTVLWLVGMTNLINLIDGADGLAGGICLMLMVLLAYVGSLSGHFEVLASGMAGALLGFLWFNFPPARIYLGDGGAYFLGFQIGLFSLVNSHKGEVFAALIAPMFALALPIIDTSVAILRRGMWGLPIFRPDRRHLHHHLQGIGFSRRKVVFSFYGVTLVFLILGFAAVWSQGAWVPGLLGVGALVLLVCAGNLSFSRQWFDVGRVVGNSLEMRREIQYALSLTHWLELEGGRQASLEELWPDFVFVVRKLGFTSVKLTLLDGQRAWRASGVQQRVHASRLELPGQAVLELEAPVSERRTAEGAQANQAAPVELYPCILNHKLFEVLCELLAEGWVKAVSRWKSSAQAPVRFGADDNAGGPRAAESGLAVLATPILKPGAVGHGAGTFVQGRKPA